MTKILSAFIFSLSIALPAFAEQWSPAGTVVLGERISFLTHNSTKWDFESDGSTGANKLMRWSVEKRLPTVVMKHSLDSDGGYYLERAADFTFESFSGEFTGVAPQVREAYFAGTYLEVCLSSTAREVLKQMSVNMESDLRMTFVMDGIRGGEFELLQDPVAKSAFYEYFKVGTPDEFYHYLNLKKILNIVKNREVINRFLLRAIRTNVVKLNVENVPHRVVVAYEGEVIGEVKPASRVDGKTPGTLTVDFASSDRLP